MQKSFSDYLLTSTLIHSVILLGLLLTPEVNTPGTIEVSIVEKSKKAESPPILPTLAKPLIPGRGSSNSKNQPQVDMTDYANQVKAVVDPVWLSHIQPLQVHLNKTYEIIILLFVDKRGNVYRSKIIKSSGDTFYDELAIQTFREANQFPIPPESVVKDGIEWTLTF